MKTFAAVLSLAFLAAGMASLRGGTLCPDPTNCTLVLDAASAPALGTGDFGTVNLALNTVTNTITVTVAMDPGWFIVKTGGTQGHAASIGFDSLGGGVNDLSGLTMNIVGWTTTSSTSQPLQFSGYASDSTADLHFATFGYANNGVGTSGPGANSSYTTGLTFTVSDGTVLTSVNQLLNPLSASNGGTATNPYFFAVDVYNGSSTGVVASDGRLAGVPEPATAALLAVGGILLFGLRFRFAKK